MTPSASTTSNPSGADSTTWRTHASVPRKTSCCRANAAACALVCSSNSRLSNINAATGSTSLHSAGSDASALRTDTTSNTPTTASGSTGGQAIRGSVSPAAAAEAIPQPGPERRSFRNRPRAKPRCA